MASDLELDLVLAVFLYSGGCARVMVSLWPWKYTCPALGSCEGLRDLRGWNGRLEHWSLGERTFRILAPADLDELLDIGDFGRHDDDLGGCGLRRLFVCCRFAHQCRYLEIQVWMPRCLAVHAPLCG